MHVAVLIDLVKAHGTVSVLVAAEGCWAIYNLAGGDVHNCSALVAAGVCKGE